MKRILMYSLSAALAALFFTSCVSNKKYLAANNRIAALRHDSSSLEGQVAGLKAQISTLEGKVSQMQASNQFTATQLNQSQEEIASQKQRLALLQARIEQQHHATEAIRQKMAEALKGFSSDQLTVTTKNGKVYVSLQESLLFPSGSAELNAGGKQAIGTVAQALNQNPDINVNVEGHTDSIPISKRYEDNWALSVARATSIARILIKDYSVTASRITASGRAENDPVATNSTPEGRAANRRTEIILEPKLDELMRLVEGVDTGAAATGDGK